ncbi:permease [Fodinisporobacter ferrooxydans]|uniref:Permease n=1 Tax=Fodinisporobacter ferrooxydans TaxID=2901836 RepID=A0ABY4CIN4_9BACL|nr:permease [Alicyclobacillaceae bacterium MYW30-H2]
MGLRKQTSSVGAAVAFWLGNTALNPAVLVFMTFVLSWKFTIIRLIFGIILVFGVAYLANRFDTEQPARDPEQLTDILSRHEPQDTAGFWGIRWLRSLMIMLIQVLPVYFISVLILGMTRAWLFPELSPVAAHSILAIIGFAIAGTLFVIPTAGEIPIIQTLQQFGLGMGPAAALLITLPVISLPSMLMVRRVFSWRVLGFLALSVCMSGIVAGLLAQFVF